MLKSSLVISVNNDRYFTVTRPKMQMASKVGGKKESVGKVESEAAKDVPTDDKNTGNETAS